MVRSEPTKVVLMFMPS